LERCKMPAKVLAELVDARCGHAFLHHHRRADELAPEIVGHPHDGDCVHAGIALDGELDLLRDDRLPSATDALPSSSRDVQVAVVVDRSEVAGVIPASVEDLSSQVWLSEVPAHQVRVADAHLAGVADSDLATLNRPAHAPWLPKDVLVTQKGCQV